MNTKPAKEATADEHDTAGRGGARGAVAQKPQWLCRSLNDLYRTISGSFNSQSEIDVVCECVKAGCLQSVLVSHDVYEDARRFPARFILKPGHVEHDSERVVLETPELVVVEKFGSDAETARGGDPRREDSPRRARK